MFRSYIIIIAVLIFALKTYGQNGKVNTFYPTDTLKSVINYSDSVRDGEAVFFYPDGQKKEELTYQNGKVNGLVKLYSREGKLSKMFTAEDGKIEGPVSLFDSTGAYMKDVNYVNGMLVPDNTPAQTAPEPATEANQLTAEAPPKSKEETKSIAKKAEQLKTKVTENSLPPSIENKNISEDPAYFLSAEIMPHPVGGMKTIMDKLFYPPGAKELGIQGTVEIRAFIDQFGDVTRAEVVKGIGHGCDIAARIAVYYTQFKPGLIKGQPVKVQMIVPVVFKVEK